MASGHNRYSLSTCQARSSTPSCRSSTLDEHVVHMILSSFVGSSPSRRPARLCAIVGAESWPFDRRTAIHHDGQSGRLGPISCGTVDDAQLQPDGSCPDRNGLVDMRAGLRGAPEDVHDVDRLIDVAQRAHAGLIVDRGALRVDRNHSNTTIQQKPHDTIGGSLSVGGEPDDRPDGEAQQAGDVVVGSASVSHPLTVRGTYGVGNVRPPAYVRQL